MMVNSDLSVLDSYLGATDNGHSLSVMEKSHKKIKFTGSSKALVKPKLAKRTRYELSLHQICLI